MDKTLLEKFDAKLEDFSRFVENLEQYDNDEILEVIKYNEISSFVSNHIQENKVKSPFQFQMASSAIIKLVKYVYNEDLIISKSIAEKHDLEHVIFTGIINQKEVFEVSFGKKKVLTTDKEEPLKEFLLDLFNL